tara:strand:- start:2581 stop:3312 length:732 start_codon:yes stop_codon:yes gene_type:complete
MNIEILLSKSINKFKQTIQIIAPLIILYTILSYLFTPPIVRTYQLDQNLDILLSQINSQDIIFSVLLIFIFSLYTIIINQFIFINIKKTIFKISDTFGALILLFIIYVILFTSFILMSLILPIPDLAGMLFMILYAALFFTIYIKIDYNKSYLESLIIGYMLFTKNFKSILKLLLMHGLALIIITYSMVIVGLLVTQIIGTRSSIMLINILFYIFSYLLSIIWIYFYFSLDKKFIAKKNNHQL